MANRRGNTLETDESVIVNFAEQHSLQYLPIGPGGDQQTERGLDQLIEALLGLVPPLPKPEQLIRKNVIVGKKLLMSGKYQLVG